MRVVNKRILKDIGLSDKEASVYLAALELGQDSAQNIAKKAQIQRPTAYVQIESLTQKGLMTTVEQGKKTLYTPEPPDRLTTLVEQQKQQITEWEEELQEVLPELKAIYNRAGGKPRVRFFEGKQGLKAMQEDVLETEHSEIEEIFSSDELHRVFSEEELRKHRQLRVQRNISARAIYTRIEGPLPKKKKKEELVELRYIPSDVFPVENNVIAYDGKVALASLKKPLLGVIIENQEIANTMKTIFQLAWHTASQYDEKARAEKENGREKE